MPSPPRRQLGFLVDYLSLALLLGFAFLAASFTARNTDLWRHLATGRLIAGGEYRFGQDPFAYTTAGRYWANHSWAFDWAAYRLFARFGPESLVVLKALAVALMAAAMAFASRARGPVWITCAGILLALLAISPRMLLQPTTGSLFLLSLCLACLRVGGRALFAVPALIALWVNVDAWFVLGPTLVTLFWIGHRLNPAREGWPQWLVPASLAACLLSPHHVLAFQWPAEISPWVWSSEFVSDPRFAGAFASPWRWAILGVGGPNPSGWAFFILFALGLASFAVNRAARRSWRIAVWLPFALMACWQIRLIPFFAVVAGPIAAVNFREVVPPGELLRSGRTFAISAAVVLLAFAWFGWLQGMNNHDRAAAWGVHTDPTLSRTADQLVDSRRTGRIPPEQRVFVTHPDLAHYLAWFAPGERYAVDARLQLFTDVAGPFKAHCQAIGILSGDPLPVRESPIGDYAVVAYYEPEPNRLTRGLAALAAKDSSWQIAAVPGLAAILTPRNVRGVEALSGRDLMQTAENGPAGLAEPGEWWRTAHARNGGRRGTWEADAAAVYLRVFENIGGTSPALPLLAVQACRVGIEGDPRDPVAWQTLGRAYLMLGERTWHREAGSGFTLLDHVRSLQLIAALTQGVLLNPDSALDHEALARVFAQGQRFDLAARHADAARALVRRMAALPGEPAAAFDERLARVTRLADDLQKIVFDSENRFVIRSVGLSADPVARARTAAELGLTQKAIDVLLSSHPDLYGVAGLNLLADLLLQSGQIAECRALLDREEIRNNPQALGYHTLGRRPNPDGSQWPYRLPAYEWFDFCQCAAAGRYAGAAGAIDRMAAQFDPIERALMPAVIRGASSLAVRELGLSTPPLPALGRVGMVVERVQWTQELSQTQSLAATRADLLTLAGLLDLERGRPDAAAPRFAAATAVYGRAKAFAISRPGEAIAARYNDAILPRP